MAKIYCVANRKGGCAKTTTVGALASGLGRLGLKVLVVDMDPQGNITDWAGFHTEDKNTAFEVLTGRCEPSEAIYEAKYYSILPADSTLAASEVELANAFDRFERLDRALEKVESSYDVVVIDTPPNLSTLSVNAFVAAKAGIIITTDAGAFATKGMADLSETLDQVKANFNPDLRVAGILLTRFNSRTNVSKVMRKLTQAYEEYFDAPIYSTPIRQSVSIMESQIDAIDIYDSVKKSAAVDDYNSFVAEFLEKEGLYVESEA